MEIEALACRLSLTQTITAVARLSPMPIKPTPRIF
jgi:hypothetical protein